MHLELYLGRSIVRPKHTLVHHTNIDVMGLSLNGGRRALAAVNAGKGPTKVTMQVWSMSPVYLAAKPCILGPNSSYVPLGRPLSTIISASTSKPLPSDATRIFAEQLPSDEFDCGDWILYVVSYSHSPHLHRLSQ